MDYIKIFQPCNQDKANTGDSQQTLDVQPMLV